MVQLGRVILTKEQFHAEIMIYPPFRYEHVPEGEYVSIHNWYTQTGRLIATRWEDHLTGENQYSRPLDLP